MRKLNGLDRLLSPLQAQLTISSNLTPEFTIDLAQAIKPDAPASSIVRTKDNILLRWMKPEIIISTLGIEKVISPYGRPQAGMFKVAIASFGAAALIGAAITWKACSKI